MLFAQLADKKDMLGRLIAVEQLSGKKEALEKLKETLNNDPYWGVRIAASQAIRALGTDEALQALVASMKQPDARVRRQLTQDLAGFYREASRDALLQLAREDKNPEIRSVAISGLGAYHTPEVHAELLKFLRSDSYRASMADGALTAIRAQDDADFIAPLLDATRENEAKWPTPVFTRGLETLAWLARNEEKKESAREFLVARVNSPKQRAQHAALRGLGTLGDPKAIGVLEKFASLPKESPERDIAEKSLAALRDAKKPGAELSSLRSELLKLQRESQALRKEFDELKKRLEAAAKAVPEKPAAKAQKR